MNKKGSRFMLSQETTDLCDSASADSTSRKIIKYTDTGKQKPTIILIHGILASKEVWAAQTRAFSRRFRVIAVDLFGFGASTGSHRASTFEDHAADLHMLIDYLELDKPDIVGWSMGAAVAIVYANLFPNDLGRLVLSNTTPSLLATDDFPYALPREAAGQLSMALTDDFEAGVASFVDLIIVEKNQHKKKRLLNKIMAATNAKVALEQFKLSADRDLRTLLSTIAAETLIISGSEDRVTLPAAAQYMAKKIPNCELREFHGIGHAPFLTSSSKFNNAVTTFIRKSKPRL